MLFVHPGADEPIVEFLRGVGKAEHRQKKEGHRRQNGQHDADAAQRKAYAADN